jgi:hypothetical protein
MEHTWPVGPYLTRCRGGPPACDRLTGLDVATGAGRPELAEALLPACEPTHQTQRLGHPAAGAATQADGRVRVPGA